MKKIKYFYNTNTLRYEKLVTPLRVKLLRIFGFLSALAVSSLIIISLYTKFFPKAADREVQLKYDNLKDNYGILDNKTKTLQQQMAELEKRDNQVLDFKLVVGKEVYSRSFAVLSTVMLVKK